MPELADRIATEMGWAALAFAYRGCGESEGQFSLGGWLDDIAAAVAHVDATVRPLGIWLAGFGTGGCAGGVRAARRPAGPGRGRPRGARATSTTGPATPAACSSTAARSA